MSVDSIQALTSTTSTQIDYLDTLNHSLAAEQSKIFGELFVLGS